MQSKEKNQVNPGEVKDLAEQEFTLKFLSLFVSMYEPTMSTDLYTPYMTQDSEEEDDDYSNKISFQSGKCDFYLQKAIEERMNSEAHASDIISEKLSSIRHQIDQETVDLTDVFTLEKTQKPDVPFYIQNMLKEEKVRFKPKKRPPPLDIGEMTKQFTMRLEKHKALTEERARKRILRLQSYEIQDKERNKNLYKSKLPEEPITYAESIKLAQEKAKRRSQYQPSKSPKKSPSKKNPRLML